MQRPEKPYPEFPLYAHRGGKWAKKIKGKTVYFGPWDDPNASLQAYHDLIAGEGSKKPERPEIPLTVQDACNAFLTAKDDAREENRLSNGSFHEYHRTCRRLVAFWGPDRPVSTLRPGDFAAYRTHRAETCNLVTVGNEIVRVKTLFKWLHEAQVLADPMRFGPDFKKPSATALRRHRRVSGPKNYTAAEVLKIADEAGVVLRAMVFLGVNCGFGNGDCETVPLVAVQEAISTGWLSFPRPKTEVDRLCPLWPETVQALEAAILRREGDGPEAFTLANGEPYSHEQQHVAKRFRAAREHAYIKRGTFYWLRHTFRTEAMACGDSEAVNAIMGHVDNSIGGMVYTHHHHRERLLRATGAVSDWLFGG